MLLCMGAAVRLCPPLTRPLTSVLSCSAAELAGLDRPDWLCGHNPLHNAFFIQWPQNELARRPTIQAGIACIGRDIPAEALAIGGVCADLPRP